MIPFGAKRIELPFAASRIDVLGEDRKVLRRMSPVVEDGRTVILPGKGDVSYVAQRDASGFDSIVASWLEFISLFDR